ncbi:hypothetical protein LguiA_006758 [Lonicera macranthoides]
MEKNLDQLQLWTFYGSSRFCSEASEIDSIELLFFLNHSWTLAFSSFILGDLLLSSC